MTSNLNADEDNSGRQIRSQRKASRIARQRVIGEAVNGTALDYEPDSHREFAKSADPTTLVAVKHLSTQKVAPILHEPQLNTILMVENTIKEAGTYLSKKSLLESLPRKVQYQTFNRILDYLESSNKIMYDGRQIIWIFPDNAKLKRLLNSSVKL